jgi:hypothetical protein
MLVIDQDLEGTVVSIRAAGTVTGKDYEEILIPALEERIARFGKVRILYTIDPDFSGVTIGAMWSDAKVIARHLNAIEKAAVVSDVRWMINLTKLFSLIMPYPVKAYGKDKSVEAKAWIGE